jgi:hypothetical protein
MKLKLTEEQIRQLHQEELSSIMQDPQIDSIIENISMTTNKEDRQTYMDLLLISLSIEKLIKTLDKIKPFSLCFYNDSYEIAGFHKNIYSTWGKEKELIDCLWEAIIKRKEDLMESNDEYDY